MKIRYITVVLFFVGIQGLAAQESELDSLAPLPVFQTSWLLVDGAWNQFYFQNKNIDNTPLQLKKNSSLQFGISIFEQRISLYRQQWNIAYAFRFEWNRFAFQNPYKINESSTLVQFDNMDTLQLKKNNLLTTSISVPLWLEFEMKPREKKKSFRVGLGGYATLNLSDKIKIQEKGGKAQTIHGDFKLPELRYGVQTRLGFSYITLLYKLDLQALFRQGTSNGYVVYPMSLGVQLRPFL